MTKILSRGTEQLVCTYEKVKPLVLQCGQSEICQDIFIPLEQSKEQFPGTKLWWNHRLWKKRQKPEGKVVEIIGHINDPGTDIMSIVKGYDLPVEFSQKIMKQVENVSNEVSAADMAGRMDLRDWQTVTIDGEDAKTLMMRSRSQKRVIFMNLGSTLPMYPTMCREQRTRRGGAQKRNVRIPCRPRDTDASTQTVKWNLFAECRREPSGVKLYHEDR